MDAIKFAAQLAKQALDPTLAGAIGGGLGGAALGAGYHYLLADPDEKKKRNPDVLTHVLGGAALGAGAGALGTEGARLIADQKVKHDAQTLPGLTGIQANVEKVIWDRMPRAQQFNAARERGMPIFGSWVNGLLKQSRLELASPAAYRPRKRKRITDPDTGGLPSAVLGAGALGAVGLGGAYSLASDQQADNLRKVIGQHQAPLAPHETATTRYQSLMSEGAGTSPFGVPVGEIISHVRAQPKLMEAAGLKSYGATTPGAFQEARMHYDSFRKGPIAAYQHQLNAKGVGTPVSPSLQAGGAKTYDQYMRPHFDNAFKKWRAAQSAQGQALEGASWLEPHEIDSSVVPLEQQRDFMRQYAEGLPPAVAAERARVETDLWGPGLKANEKNYKPVIEGGLGLRDTLKTVGMTAGGAGLGGALGHYLGGKKKRGIGYWASVLGGAGLGGAAGYFGGTPQGQGAVMKLLHNKFGSDNMDACHFASELARGVTKSATLAWGGGQYHLGPNAKKWGLGVEAGYSNLAGLLPIPHIGLRVGTPYGGFGVHGPLPGISIDNGNVANNRWQRNLPRGFAEYLYDRAHDQDVYNVDGEDTILPDTVGQALTEKAPAAEPKSKPKSEPKAEKPQTKVGTTMDARSFGSKLGRLVKRAFDPSAAVAAGAGPAAPPPGALGAGAGLNPAAFGASLGEIAGPTTTPPPSMPPAVTPGMPAVNVPPPDPNMGMQHAPGGPLSVMNQPGGLTPGAETQPSGLGTQRLFDQDARMAAQAALKAPKPVIRKPMAPPAPTPAAGVGGLAKGAQAFAVRLGKQATDLYPSMEGQDKRPDRPRLTDDKIKPWREDGHAALKSVQRQTMRPDGKNLLKRPS